MRNEGGRAASSPQYEVIVGKRVLTSVLSVCVLLKPDMNPTVQTLPFLP